MISPWIFPFFSMVQAVQGSLLRPAPFRTAPTALRPMSAPREVRAAPVRPLDDSKDGDIDLDGLYMGYMG